MNDARPGREALRPTRPDRRDVAKVVAVLDLPAEQVGDRLEAPVRVLRKASARAELEMIEHHERVVVHERRQRQMPRDARAGTLLHHGRLGSPDARIRYHRIRRVSMEPPCLT